MTTPDEYRYAKAHLRAAMADIKTAMHYLRGDQGSRLELNVARGCVADIHDKAEQESLKAITPKAPAP